MISDLITPAVIIGILASGIRLATPYLFATIGEMFSQLSGVLNLGVEGIMLMSAFTAFYVGKMTGNLWLGFGAALVMGALLGLLMAFVSVTMKAEQGISGIGLYLFGLGMSDLLFQVTFGTIQTINGFSRIDIPLLSNLPIIGRIFFSHNALTYLAFALVPISWFIINKTTFGIKLKAVGQNPAAADSLGVSVDKVRYSMVTLGGIMAGAAGASLSIALLNVFQQNMTSGIGFISVALVYFGAWSPIGILLGSLLFSTVNSLQLWIQALGINIPAELAIMMPYILTILALTLATQRAINKPAALTKPFTRGA